MAVGYSRLAAKGDLSYDWSLAGSTFHDRLPTRTRLISVPLALLFHVKVPIGRNIKLTLSTGAECGFHHFHYEMQYESSLFGGGGEDYVFDGQKIAFGFRAGLDLEITLSSGVALILEGFQRLGQLTGIRGNYERSGRSFGVIWTESGDDHILWYYEEQHQEKTYPKIVFDSDPPARGTNPPWDIRFVRPASLGLSGVVVRAGLKLSL